MISKQENPRILNDQEVLKPEISGKNDQDWNKNKGHDGDRAKAQEYLADRAE